MTSPGNESRSLARKALKINVWGGKDLLRSTCPLRSPSSTPASAAFLPTLSNAHAARTQPPSCRAGSCQNARAPRPPPPSPVPPPASRRVFAPLPGRAAHTAGVAAGGVAKLASPVTASPNRRRRGLNRRTSVAADGIAKQPSPRGQSPCSAATLLAAILPRRDARAATLGTRDCQILTITTF